MNIPTQKRPLYLQLEWSEEDLYKSLSSELYFHIKAVVEETYKNGYHFTVKIDKSQPELFALSHEFEKVTFPIFSHLMNL